MKRRLLIALAVLGVVVVVATVVFTGVIPMGTVILRLDQDTYRPDETVTLTIRSLRTGVVAYGDIFEVQRFEDGDWVGVPLDRGWLMWLGVMSPGRAFHQSFVPAEHFFETPEPGRYRVVKEVRVGMIHYGADRETLTLIAEFRIES